MYRPILLLLILSMSFMAAGCGTITYEANVNKPVLLGSNLEKPHRLERSAINKGKQLWLFWWFIPVGKERGQALTELAQSGDGLKNVTIHESYDVVDWFVQNWSAFLIGVPGITNTLNEDYTADVIEFQEGGQL